MNIHESILDISRGDITEEYFDKLFFGAANFPEGEYENLSEAISFSLELDDRKVFLEGLVDRLNKLGVPCTIEDTEVIRKETTTRLKIRCGLSGDQTKNYRNWINGKSAPSIEKRRELYTLCYALEMNYIETAEFFVKSYLTIPYNYKDSTDAIFFYCLKNGRDYNTIVDMLNQADSFSSVPESQDTVSIGRQIIEIDDDAEFMQYLARHTYNKEQRFSTAKREIQRLVASIKSRARIPLYRTKSINGTLEDEIEYEYIKSDSQLIEFLFGINYQRAIENKELLESVKSLPKRFLDNLPNDTTYGQLFETPSYESIRKTLIILEFFDFYYEREIDENNVNSELDDFDIELNNTLTDCGLPNIYFRHPFDCLIYFCANSLDPIELFRELFSLKYEI